VANNVDSYFDNSHIFTNPARFTDSGCLTVDYFHSGGQAFCSRCPRNLCKGRVVAEILQKKSGTLLNREHVVVVYVGDGRGDACPCLQLIQQDLVLAREGFALHSILESYRPRKGNDASSLDEKATNATSGRFVAQLEKWKSDKDVWRQIQRVLEANYADHFAKQTFANKVQDRVSGPSSADESTTSKASTGTKTK